MLIKSEQYDLIFNTIDAAQINMTEFATITQVSRVTLYRWKKLHPTKDIDKLRFGQVYNIAVRMRNAITQGKLPLIEKVSKKDKLSIVKRIIRTTPAVLPQ